MPRLSKKAQKELLEYMDWQEISPDVWRHPEYQVQPGPIPDLTQPEQLPWLMAWLLSKEFHIKFASSQHKNSLEYYVIVKSGYGGPKWVVRDYNQLRPHNAMLSVILKIKNFPDGAPKKRPEYLAGLAKIHGKEIKSPEQILAEAKKKYKAVRERLEAELEKEKTEKSDS